ncbi:MAG: hypothetical protein ACR2JM_13750, partial [Mycobacterium sp.]
AVIHLVAHGFYKSTLFLSSGSAITRQRRHRVMPESAPPAGRRALGMAVAAVALPALALAIAVTVAPLPPGDHAAEQALLIFAWATGSAALWGWLRRNPGLRPALAGAALLLPASIGYVWLVNAVSGYLTPALPPAGLSAASVWALAAAALTVLGLLAALRRSRGAIRLQRALYTGALGAGFINPMTTGARS